MSWLEIFFDKCERLGKTFGFGFLEGLIIYGVILTIVILKIIDMIIKKRKIKKK